MRKKQITARIIAVVFLLSLLISLGTISANAAAPSSPPLDEANAVWLYHVESGSVICEKNANQTVAAGSSVKVMAGLLFCEQLYNRQTEWVLITDDMVSVNYGRRLGLQSGDRVAVVQLLYAAICGSYNDAYDALAVYLAGSKAAFVAQMNQNAHALGALHTTFTDPSGIDDSSRTTANDIGIIATKAQQNDFYMQLNSTVRYEFNSTSYLRNQTIYNPNALLSTSTTAGYYNSRCKGMSAGETTQAGSCVISSASNGKETYLSVVLGGRVENKINYAYEITNRMIKWVYNTYTYLEVISPDTEICKIPIAVSDVISELDVRVKESYSLYLPKSYEVGKDITYSIRLTDTELEAPVKDGTFVGYVAVIEDGHTLATFPLYTVGSAERSGFMSSMKSLQALTSSRAFLAGSIFFAVVLIAWISIENWIIHRKRHKWDKYFSMKMNPVPIDKNLKKK